VTGSVQTEEDIVEGMVMIATKELEFQTSDGELVKVKVGEELEMWQAMELVRRIKPGEKVERGFDVFGIGPLQTLGLAAGRGDQLVWNFSVLGLGAQLRTENKPGEGYLVELSEIPLEKVAGADTSRSRAKAITELEEDIQRSMQGAANKRFQDTGVTVTFHATFPSGNYAVTREGVARPEARAEEVEGDGGKIGTKNWPRANG